MTDLSRKLLFGSLAVVVFGAKLTKIALSYLKYLPAGRVTTSIVILAVVAVAVTVAATWAVRRIQDEYEGLSYGAAVGSMLVLLLLVTEAVVATAFGGYRGLIQKGLVLFSWDAILVIVLILIGGWLLDVARKGWLLFAQVFVYVTVWLVMTATTADLAYFITTGTNANWHLLQFVIRNPGLALPAMTSGMNPVQIGLLSIPLVAILLTAVGQTATRKKRYLNRPVAEHGRRWLAAGAALSILSVVFISDDVATDISRPFVRNPIIDIVRDMVVSPAWNQEEITAGLPTPILPHYSEDALLAPRTNARPNVALVIIESGRASSMPPSGMPRGVMPFLERISGRSLVIDRVYPATPCTSESLISLLYGVYPPMTARLSYADIRRPSWPTLFGQLGYRSGFFSAVDFVDSRGEREMVANMGFEVVMDGRDLSDGRSATLNYSGSADDVFLEKSLQWLDQTRESGAPFFVTYHTNVSHHPYTLPESIADIEEFVADEAYNRYLNALRYSDGILERLFGEFESRRWIGNTVFVIVGDHGELFGEHGTTFPHCHFLWEDAIRVPLIIHAPRLIRQQYIHPGPLQLVDVFPTVADLLRYEVTGDVTVGVSAVDGLAREPIMLSASANQSMALMRDSLKFIYYFGRQPLQVFNIIADRAESRNLAATVPNAVKASVEAQLLNWRRAVNATYGL
jgi:arylsulfatase A-like enzyme